ncbi:hypothetical protein PGT21_008952 [Puccinia graminis f. sp. tritici]|uniref:Uncharacterized protein n=1 Tax=Puccinia graminis f. sp. tritici TaxID=56615 RepID=A0A5B0PBZ6_PUCGR|nr:hypothetical protein PGT21_008952 [Puccinia graminis f. sp. tritici]KAA1099095.1 hypothetical protein PGTUg99_018072 [Puccinia graminis f. sp. tritici]
MKLGGRLPEFTHTLEDDSQWTSADGCWESLAKKWESFFRPKPNLKPNSILNHKLELYQSHYLRYKKPSSSHVFQILIGHSLLISTSRPSLSNILQHHLRRQSLTIVYLESSTPVPFHLDIIKFIINRIT